MKALRFVGLPDHTATRSTEFLVELLKEKYEVSVSGSGDVPDEGFKNADVFFFFQRAPDERQLEAIGKRPVAFAPMYDEARNYGRDTIRRWRSFSIISFCQSIHKDLDSWGFQTAYYQYWPRPSIRDIAMIPVPTAFYWRRESHYVNEAISPVLVDLLLDGAVRIHAHAGRGDAEERVLAPRVATRTSWFQDKDELNAILRGCDIYIAPRESEGIGMSFLDAMANGLAVIGADNPTINEYIEDGRNGYLFDPRRPRRVELRNKEAIRTAALESCIRGAERWEREKWGILERVEIGPRNHSVARVPRRFRYRSLKERRPAFRIKQALKRILRK